jgi:hypothetical protein
MAATTVERLVGSNDSNSAPLYAPCYFDVAAATKILGGTIVCVDASGNATPAVTDGSAVSTLKVVGIARDTADNTSGSAGDLKIAVYTGISLWENGDTITKTSIGAVAFAGDNQTVYKASSSGKRPVCGIIRGLDSAGKVWVQMLPGFVSGFSSAVSQVENATFVGNSGAGALTDAQAETAIFRIPNNATITSIKIVPTGAVSANDTNYATITIARRDGAGGSPATISAPTTKITGGTGNWVAFTTIDLTLANTYCAAGTVITYAIAKAAAGISLPSFVISVNYTVAP